MSVDGVAVKNTLTAPAPFAMTRALPQPVIAMNTRCSARMFAPLIGLTLLVAASVTRAASPEPTPAMVVDSEIRFLTFVAGERLTGNETSRLTAATLTALATDRETAVRGYRSQGSLLGKAEKDHTYTASLRRANRELFQKNVSKYSEDNINGLEARVAARHDPVVAADPARDLLFTRRSIADLHAGAGWLARILDVPGPTAAFDDEIAATLRAQLRQIDQTLATQMLEVGQNQYNAQDWFEHADQGMIANVKSKLRASLSKPTAISHNLVMAQSAGTVTTLGAKQAQALVQSMATNIMKLNMSGMAHQGAMMQLNQMTQRQQTTTQRRASPACMTGSAGLSWCNGGNE